MPFNTFTPNTVIKSSEVNANFQNAVHKTDLQVIQNKISIPVVLTDNSGGFDLSLANWFVRTLDGSNGTLSLSSETVGQLFAVEIINNGSAITWFSGIIWVDNVAPTLSASGRRDVFVFRVVSAGVYLGFIAGQNML